MKFFLPQKCLNKTQIAFIFSSLIKKEAPMKRISKRIRSAAGKVMSSKDGYEVRDAIASALVDVADAMEDYEKPKLMRRICIICTMISACISAVATSLFIYLLK